VLLVLALATAATVAATAPPVAVELLIVRTSPPVLATRLAVVAVVPVLAVLSRLPLLVFREFSRWALLLDPCLCRRFGYGRGWRRCRLRHVVGRD
jgi:hypothetical protein